MKDENYGHGGSYIIDLKTGVRKLVERTNEKAEAVAPAPITPDDDEHDEME